MAKITGTKKNDKLLGTSAADTISGLAGNDLLDGKAGADTLIGGLGNDTYVIDNIKDKATELANQGTDLIKASVSFSLGLNVENITLTGIKAINATGNDLDNIIIGNSAANILTGGLGIDTISGGAGDDTYVIAAADIVSELSAGGNDTVFIATDYTLLDNFENLVLTGVGDFNANGNAAVNVITGNDYDNTLDGKTGADTLIGGLGNDTYIYDDTDVMTELFDEGFDRVIVDFSYTLLANFEDLTLTGTGNINGTGNSDHNDMKGNSGNNILDGGSNSDFLVGGAGDDTYIVDFGDTVFEDVDSGIDTVKSTVAYTLTANVENLILIGTANINGTGNSGGNSITGNDGNNSLDGGAGADALAGGKGDDTYIIDSSDTLTENANEGTDTVKAGFSHTLGLNFENLTLTGTGNINGTGNSADNTITGNSGVNVLDGGAGADTLVGGKGDDTYFIDADDVLTENSGEGSDTVVSAESHTLGVNFENLTLSGAGNVDGTGNGADNTIFGTDGDNVLNGLAGADYLDGGVGNDTYYVDTLDDVVVEDTDSGIDTIKAAGSYTLAAGVSIEEIDQIGVGNFSLIGNALANALVGNSGNDFLDGNGGLDTLTGGKGDDTYVVYGTGEVLTELAGGGTDTIELRGTIASYTLDVNFENATVATGALIGTVVGNAAANILTGNEQSNIFETGNTTGVGSGSKIVDMIYGGLETDTLTATDGVVTFDGGGDYDMIDFTNFVGGITATLTGTLSGVVLTNGFADNKTTLQSIEFIGGSEGDDSFIFQAGAIKSDLQISNGGGADTFQFAFDEATGTLLAGAVILSFSNGNSHLVFDTATAAFDTPEEIFAVLSAGATAMNPFTTKIVLGDHSIQLWGLQVADFDASDILVI